MTTDIEPNVPLILDLDGTLVRNDMTHELVLATALHSPGDFPDALRLGKTDKPAMKAFMYERHGDRLRADHLPYQPEIISLAERYRDGGAKVYLCSGSIQETVTRVVDHLDWVEDGWGTTPDVNLTSENKAAFLMDRFPDGFDYAGNSTQDYAVWEKARRAYAIHPPSDTSDRTDARGKPVDILEPRSDSLASMGRVFSPGPWAIGLLLPLLPLLIGTDYRTVVILAAYLSFSLLATALNIFANLAHINPDRETAKRRHRPLPSGRTSVPQAGVVILVCLIFGLALLSFLPLPLKLALPALFVAGLFAVRAGWARTACPMPKGIVAVVPLLLGAMLVWL